MTLPKHFDNRTISCKFDACGHLSAGARLTYHSPIMSPRALSLALPLALAACGNYPPARPVPPHEAKRTPPAWHPETPWTASGAEGRVFLEGKVVFETGQAQIRASAERVLLDLLAYLNANPDITRLRIEGHTDPRAGEDFNQKLSERRALAVADWLVDHGIDHDRLLAVAFGEMRPLWPPMNSTAMQENRRAEFHVAEVNGNRFQGEDPTNGGLVLYVKSKQEREAEKRKGPPPNFALPRVKAELDVIKAVEAKQQRDLLEEPEPPAPAPPPKKPEGEDGTKKP